MGWGFDGKHGQSLVIVQVVIVNDNKFYSQNFRNLTLVGGSEDLLFVAKIKTPLHLLLSQSIRVKFVWINREPISNIVKYCNKYGLKIIQIG